MFYSGIMPTVDALSRKFEALACVLDERTRRLVAAAEASAIGHGGVTLVAAASGLSRGTVMRGIAELRTAPRPERSQPIRRKGAGRKRTVDQDATLKRDLEALVEPVTPGHPETPLRWTCKSVRQLAAELRRMGHQTSHRMVAELLHQMDYSLQANRKTLEGSSHPDRDAQFHHISDKIREFQAAHQPVISVDTKKKERVGEFRNNGRELRPKGDPEPVRVHDFLIPELGRAAPYGVYDVTRNAGWVSVGMDHDTAAFAAQSVRRWWESMGSDTYPKAARLLIAADSGESNGAGVRVWKLELQKLADETGLEISICHLPPGTSKWNRIEHRLFSFISQNWRGKPLVSHQVIVNLIAATTTKTGLRVRAEIDPATYPKGVKVSDQDAASIRMERDAFHGEWNYVILPRSAWMS